MVEVGRDAAHAVDPRSAERLVALEVRDVEVPPPRGVRERPPLYFRILVANEASVRVELWELGALRGAKSVFLAGSPQLRGRRIALAAAELARQLRRRRLAELASVPASPGEGQRPRGDGGGFPLRAGLTLTGGATTALVGTETFLAGPVLAGSLRFDSGPYASLRTAWLLGATGPEGVSGVRWFEAGLDAGYTLELGRSASLDLGAGAAAASVRLRGVAEAGGAEPFDSWSARAVLAPKLGLALGRSARGQLGLEAGALLHRLDYAAKAGDLGRLSGPWLGASLLVELGQRPTRR